MSDAVWTTMQGDKIPIKWMDSIHLIHSFNMVCRKNSITALNWQKWGDDKVMVAFVAELDSRGLLKWASHSSTFSQLDTVQVIRETPVELCMLRALIDTGSPSLVKSFRRDRQRFIDQVIFDAQFGEPDAVRLNAKFVEYRLGRP